jgi:TonB family protein
MKAKIEGYVGLAAIVKADGATGGVVVTHSLDTQYGLDERAVEALRQARWKPGTKDGKPVNVRIEVNMRFTLK